MLKNGSAGRHLGVAVDMFAAFSLACLAVTFFYHFALVGLFPAHDEAEHLHVAFLIEQGQRPYLDFIENHPALFHLLMLQVKRLAGDGSVLHFYSAVKVLLALACAGSFCLAGFFSARFLRASGTPFRPISIFFIACGVLTPWGNDFRYLWELRPDWLCIFLSLICIYLHFLVHAQPFRYASLSLPLLALAGTMGGLATALMPKSIFIFAPYGFVAILVAGNMLRKGNRDLLVTSKAILMGNALFVLVGVATFVTAVFVELHATGATIDAYVRANFWLNKIKHPVIFPVETNPAAIIGGFLGGSFALMVALSLFAAAKLAAYRDEQNSFGFLTLAFLCAVVWFNVVFPAFANGVLWPQYFIPSLLAVAVLGTLAINDFFVFMGSVFERGVMHALGKRREVTFLALRTSLGLLALGGIVMIGLGQYERAEAAQGNFELTREMRRIVCKGNLSQFPLERMLPNELSYFAFSPTAIPAGGRTWGYYFMLGPDRRFWLDNHLMGLGPDPRSHFRELYGTRPPDVIAPGDVGIKAWISTLRETQGVDLGWLIPEMRTNYVCVAQSVTAVWVRCALTDRFLRNGWKTCPVSSLSA